MIKFFRKIRFDLMEKNLPAREGTTKQAGKTGKYLKYAIGEIVLVVIGILIALSINNWNQDRIYNKERKYLISELLTEFENNLEQINLMSYRNELLIAKSDTIIDALSNLNFPGDEKKLAELLAGKGVLNIATYNPSAGMMNSMSNTSNFQHINDKTLRRNLLNWSGAVNDMKENEIIAYENSRVTLPDYLSRFSIFGDLETVRNVKMKGDVVTNPLELRNKLIHNRDLKMSFLNEGKGLTRFMEKIIEQLKQELNTQ